MLLSGWQAEVLTGEAEILVPARLLAQGNDRVSHQPVPRVTYVHLLFDRHEILFAEGAPSESYHPFGADAQDRAPALMAELQALSPDLTAGHPVTGLVRPCMEPHEAALLAL